MAGAVTGEAHATFVFETTTSALWAEEVARDAGIPVEVVPAPAEADARCDLALVTRTRWTEALCRALEGAGVPFRRWQRQ